MTYKPELRLQSSIPGRERWEIEGLIGKVSLASHLEQALRLEDGVIFVQANPVTGRILVRFHVDRDVHCSLLIQTHLESILIQGVVESPRSRKAEGNALLQLLGNSPLTSRHGVAMALSISSQIVAVARRFTLISTINLAINSAGLTALTGPSLGFMTGLLIVMIAVEGILDHFRTVAWERLARDAEQRIQEPLIRHIQHLDVSFFESQGSGRLMNLVGDDVAKIGRFVESIGDNLVEGIISVLWAGGMLLWLSPSLFGLSALPLPFVVLAAWGLGPMVSRRMALASTRSGNYSQHLGNSLAGIIDIKNFTAEDRESNKLVQYAQAANEASVDAASASSMQYQVIQGLFGTGFTLAIGYAGSLVMSGQVLPDRTLHVLYWFPNLMSSVAKLHGVTKQYHSAVRAAENIQAVMNLQPGIVSGPVVLPAKPRECEITFDSVSFAYETGTQVLTDVSFNVQPGQMLAIVGPTGSGKSTLLRLLLRHYDVNEGRILMNGEDIRQLNLRDLRKSIAVVGQDVYLFQGSVRDNVLYGRPDATADELEEAMRDSGTDTFLSDLPSGEESEVGERGQRLSGGQRQRIAIARALLKEAPVLALDEATSHLDYETESIVQRSIRTSTEGRALIVVAHRLSTVRRANKIVVLESGQIRERGTHDELIQQGGLYASLWRLQNGTSDEVPGEVT